MVLWPNPLDSSHFQMGDISHHKQPPTFQLNYYCSYGTYMILQQRDGCIWWRLLNERIPCNVLLFRTKHISYHRTLFCTAATAPTTTTTSTMSSHIFLFSLFLFAIFSVYLFIFILFFKLLSCCRFFGRCGAFIFEIYLLIFTCVYMLCESVCECLFSIICFRLYSY